VSKDHLSAQTEAEDDGSAETQAEIARSVRKWGRATSYLGLALIISAGSWFLFFPGHPLHRLWQAWGRMFAVTTICILLPFLFAAGTTFSFWFYGANLRKIDRDYAPGGKYDRGE
jgi:hypothetical protein